MKRLKAFLTMEVAGLDTVMWRVFAAMLYAVAAVTAMKFWLLPAIPDLKDKWGDFLANAVLVVYVVLTIVIMMEILHREKAKKE